MKNLNCRRRSACQLRIAALAASTLLLCSASTLASAQPSQADGAHAPWGQPATMAPDDAPMTLSARLRGVVQDKLGPLYDSVADLLRPASARLTWGGPVHFDGVVPTGGAERPDFTRAFTPSESLGDTTEESFSPLMLNPRRFRVPWLVAPNNLFHAMPVLPVATLGAVHIDLVGASLGTNSGTSAAYLEMGVRF